MCGIAGLIDPSLAGDDARLRRIGVAMAGELAHRGPDAEGVWTDAAAGAVLAHRRLSIIDLTPTGAQPMLSADGRWAITYNGELYNTAELRDRLRAEGAQFRGTSDTEVLVEAAARWGVERAVRAANGMFAIAFFDRKERALHLVRDRLGIKPLYWTARGGRVAFGSELDAVLAAGGERPQIDPLAASVMMTVGHVLGERSIWRGISRLAPGHIEIFRPGREPEIDAYWSLRAAALGGMSSPFTGSDNDAEAALADLLGDAVARQMVSDVSIGAFLSGGIDSSAVVALMQKASARPVKTFTIGFADRELNEAKDAAAVARHLGTDHTELTATEADTLAIVPRLAGIYDEPFADSSQIPTVLVSALTRKHVTVALSGDGGDEVFAGYNRHRFAAGAASWPQPLRSAAGMLAGLLSRSGGGSLASALPLRLPSRLDDKLRKLADALSHDEADGYRRLVSQNALAPADAQAELDAAFALPDSSGLSALSRMQWRDAAAYLPDDILTKVDRASMSVALEARVPLLDHQVVEFAWRLPAAMRVRNGRTKWLLRRVLARHVPAELVERPKQGFAVPLGAWLRGPLREWAHALLMRADFAGGLVEAAPVRALWERHQSGAQDNALAVWPFLMFEAWREKTRAA